MGSEWPDTGAGAEGMLTAELLTKAGLNESHVERTLNKRDDLRATALENYASQKAQSHDAFPLIRVGNIQHSPNKTTSTMASEHTALGPLGHEHVGLKRQGSATFSTGAIPRSHRSSSPTKRAVAAVLESYQEIVGRGSEAQPAEVPQPQGSQGSEPCGLDFLLQACDMLEPGAEVTNACNNAAHGFAGGQAAEQAQQVTSRGRRSRRPSDEGEFDCSGHSTEEDDDYKPAKRPNGRPARRAASARAAAVVATSAPSNLRWERGLVTGPCTNPDCEHPYDSPQWRKGPPTNPILCNACGTRWLRNGTLKPLVPRRGIRYGKARPKGSVKAAANARATAAAARAARKEAGAELGHRHERYEDSEEQVEQGWAEDADMDMEEHVALSRPSSDPLPLPLKPTNYPAAASQPLSAGASFGSQEDSSQALASALAAVIPGLASASVLPQGAASFDPVALHQQLASMSAAAQAAQQAFAAAKVATSMQTIQPPKPLEGVARPMFHIRAVAGPPMAAPRYDEPMQEDGA